MRPLTYHRDGFDYKITAEAADDRHVKYSMTLLLSDSRTPEAKKALIWSSTCSWPWTKADARDQAAELVAWFGAHESLEWLRDDETGRLVRDPHVRPVHAYLDPW